MFDPETIKLMQDAPKLDGLKQSDIPKLLTEAYAQIVAARIRLRELQSDDANLAELRGNIEQLSRLAATQEAFVAASRNRENRASAAFVAGSAHHARILYDQAMAAVRERTSLTSEYISPEVSAALLFLTAEATADAAEMAKMFNGEPECRIEKALLDSISLLSSGRLQALLSISPPSEDDIGETFSDQAATRTLYLLLFHCVRAIAAQISDSSGDLELMEENPEILIERVILLCSAPLEFGADTAFREQKSIFSGPLHLASLLSCAHRDLVDSALLNLAPPNEVDAEKWGAILRNIAKERPFLWRNHRQAVSEGYLEPGVSSAISFPTGAGKSTLSELKVATTLIRNKQVIFLAPTLALVDQTTRALKASFPDLDIFREQSLDLSLETDLETLSPISILTPERCLALLNFRPELFLEVGLVVFDECHLLHPREPDKSRRAVDAMLCILNLNHLAPQSDFLFLSAMMKNTSEIAQWIGQLTGRPCLPLDLLWKPTRQVRGCVVYGETEIKSLKATLRAARDTSNNKAPPVATGRQMVASPFGFFCLHQTWQTTNRDDYSLIPLLDETVTIGTGKALPDEFLEVPETATNKDYRWYLTPNGLQVSADLAEASSKKNLKTIVFVQTIPNSISTDKSVSKRLKSGDLSLTDEEQVLYDLIVEELGGNEHTYLKLTASQGSFANSSVCHHGHLLPLERQLHESIFKRSDGVNVMIATSTLSQGMNLPSDIVIIGGDSRFDLDAEKMEQLEAHELLNAAGRAGRAGDRSHGFVLVVPSKLVHFNDETNRIHKYWTELQGIFSQSDQCVVIEDPLLPILDHIHTHSAADTVMTDYLVGRLQFNVDHSSEDSDAASILINRSLAAYQAKQRGDIQWVSERVVALRAAGEARQRDVEWKEQLAASSGVPVVVVAELAEMLAVELRFDATTEDWFVWISSWLSNNPQHLVKLIRKDTLENFMGTAYKKTSSEEKRAQLAKDLLFPLLSLWMHGATLSDVEEAYGTKPHLVKSCEKAREFALRIIPELAYLFGLPNLVLKAMKVHEGAAISSPLGLDTLGACVRKGFNRIEQLAYDITKDGVTSRREVHREFETFRVHLPPLETSETLGTIIGKIELAIMLRDLSQ